MDVEGSQGIQLQLDSPWSRLVSTAVEESDDGEIVPIIGDKLSIGRKRALVDLVIPGNLHVSGCHCVLNRHPGSKVTLTDTSSNGTLLNGKRLEKNEETELVHNDVITIVSRKDNPRLNIEYRFENLQEVDSTLTLSQDKEAGKDEEEVMDVTEEMKEGSEEVDVGQKRKASQEGFPITKVTRTSLSPASPSSAAKPMDAEDTAKQGTPEEASQPSKPAIAKEDSIAETLICQICQDILHDCVSLQPCMHSYCAGCYSAWMAESPHCPACRKKVKRISKNHIVNNLVDAYLRANPDRARSAQDLEELDSKNKITHDMLYPKKRADYDSDDTEDDSDDSSEDHGPAIFSTTGPYSLPTGMLSLCPQCPHHAARALSATLLYPYTCTTTTPHVLCQCCLRPMPNRNDPTIPQKCELCGNFFCALYWSCNSSGCSGCVAMLKEFNFQPTCLNGILGNAYESTIFKDYLQSKGLGVKDFQQACCEKLERGEYVCSDSRVSSTSVTCRTCALKALKELAYQYRRDIPGADLPEEVNRRVDCYWGKECRTQFNKPEHAKKFNHVCEKTRQS